VEIPAVARARALLPLTARENDSMHSTMDDQVTRPSWKLRKPEARRVAHSIRKVGNDWSVLSQIDVMSRSLCRDGRTTEPRQKRARGTNECEHGEGQNERKGQTKRQLVAECTEPIDALLLLHITARRGKCLVQTSQ
jgi:hypothetical protein